MIRLIATRLAFALGSLLLISVVVFAITALLPGDAAQAALGQAATPEAVKALRATLGLDLPPWLRYLHWLGGMLHGDPGQSLAGAVPVSSLIGSRLPNSFLLAAVTAGLGADRADPGHHHGDVARVGV